MPTAPSGATIKLKRTLVTGYVPTTAQLQQGELAVNVADGLLYLKRVSGGNEQIYAFMPMQIHPLVSLSSAGSAGLSLDGQELSVADGYAIPDSAKVSNWDTAYGWGNHASAGYLTAQPWSAGSGAIYYNSGNVGIGTSAPSAALHVEGPNNMLCLVSTSTLAAGSGGSFVAYAKNLPTAAGQRLGSFSFGSRNAAEETRFGGSINYFAEGAWTAGTSHPTYLTIKLGPSGSGTPAEVLRITSAGNIGIGLTSGIGSKLTFAADTVAAGGILFGADTNLYRSAANMLQTDDTFVVAVGGGGKNELQITSTAANTGITIGGDTNLYRFGANMLRSDDDLWVAKISINAMNTAPASASALGTVGDIRIVDGYIYVCVASNTWKRAALTTW